MSVGWGTKTLLAALATLLLGAGLVSCGGGEGTDAGATEAASGQTSSEGGSADFTPKEHQDSGGGSDQFRVKGGDNSVQEFGEEADAAEFDEAAATLHNFLDARAASAWAAACKYIASNVIDSLQELATQSQRLKGAACAEILDKLTNPAAKDLLREEAQLADVGSLRVEGDRAFVLYRGPEGEVLAVPMAREDGSWKVGTLASIPLS